MRTHAYVCMHEREREREREGVGGGRGERGGGGGRMGTTIATLFAYSFLFLISE